MLRDAIRAGRRDVAFTIICGVAYPAVVWAIGQGAFNHQANGSIVKVDGKAVGSSMIGQTFTSARYFHPRPTALAVDGKEFYDASTSGGSNLGPNSKDLADTVAGAPEGGREDLRRHRAAGAGRHGHGLVLGTRSRHLGAERAHPGARRRARRVVSRSRRC